MAKASTSGRRAPRDEAELLRRAEDVAGLTLGELARTLGWPVPEESRRAKGWGGQLLEAALGAQAGSRPAPDFEHLGIELKTIPVNASGRPRESTFVCNAELSSDRAPRWEDSRAHHKLAAVLFVPVLGDKGSAPATRQFGMPFLWRPGPDEEAGLRADWEALMELVTFGGAEHISAEHGDWLQLRPKGANSAARTTGTDADGRVVQVLPLGFYLRASFTAQLLARHYAGLAGR